MKAKIGFILLLLPAMLYAMPSVWTDVVWPSTALADDAGDDNSGGGTGDDSGNDSDGSTRGDPPDPTTNGGTGGDPPDPTTQ